MKKLLTLILAFAMIFSMLPMAEIASALENEAAEEYVQTTDETGEVADPSFFDEGQKDPDTPVTDSRTEDDEAAEDKTDAPEIVEQDDETDNVINLPDRDEEERDEVPEMSDPSQDAEEPSQQESETDDKPVAAVPGEENDDEDDDTDIIIDIIPHRGDFAFI